MKNVLYSLFGVIAGFILAGILLFVSRAPAGEPIVLQPAPTQSPIEVHVMGGVVRPGLYSLADGARVQDAIDAAGGLITTADAGTLNLARKIEDGEQLNIPCVNDSCPVNESALSLPSDSSSGDVSGGDNGSVGGNGADGGDTTYDNNDNTGYADDPYADLIDVNSASLEELETLPGIGAAIAQRIIDYREENGCFIMPEGLLQVTGIGEKTLDNIRDLITTDYCQ